MLKLVGKLFAKLEASKVTYCHWKSNNNLEESLNGKGDLDLLIQGSDYDIFIEIISSLKFRLAESTKGVNNPFVFHYFAPDLISGKFVHLHVYFRIVTGGSLFKNHWVPVEDMLLGNRIKQSGVYVPSRETDLIVFVLRKFIEQPSPAEHLLFYKDYKNIKKELFWMCERCDTLVLEKSLAKYLPCIPSELFFSGLNLLQQGDKPFRFNLVFKRIILGRKIVKCLPYTLKNQFQVFLIRHLALIKMWIVARIKSSHSKKIFKPGGMIVSFVGSEASGKSTLSENVSTWLAGDFNVVKIHLGKPPKTIYTRGPYLLISIYSFLKRQISTSKVAAIKSSRKDYLGNLNEPHPIVAFLDAIDRFCLIKKCVRKMLNGAVIVTDRYPEQKIGGLDGPRIINQSPFYQRLAKQEKLFYSMFAPSDIIFRVMAPLEVTLKRNSERDAPEPDDFVKMRYAKAEQLTYPGIRVVNVDTTKKIDETLRLIKAELWNLSK
jgi:hypothetical protein